MTLISAASHYFSDRARKVIIQKYNLTSSWGKREFDTLFAVYLLSNETGWVGSTDILKFLSVNPKKEVTHRNMRYRLKRLVEKGFITLQVTHARYHEFQPSAIGVAIMRGYFEMIEEGVELMVDTGTLPPKYIEEWKNYLK